MLRGVVNRALNGRHEEHQYLDLVKDILHNGEFVKGRNGDVKTVIGAAMCFNLSNGVTPILTTKRVAWKACLKELLWFISGSTDNRVLLGEGVKIWSENASREFLDSRGLYHLEEGDLGPIYGHQWRHFNARYTTFDDNYDGKGVDQLRHIIDTLSNPKTRSSRRMVMSAWNPCQQPEMALPPCHVLCQFNVIEDRLYCSLYQRSGDVGLGVPFNIASYSILTHLIAHHCGLKAHEFHYYLENCHIYDDHIEALEVQSTREPFEFPTLDISGDPKVCIDQYVFEDFMLNAYKSAQPVKMIMRK